MKKKSPNDSSKRKCTSSSLSKQIEDNSFCEITMKPPEGIRRRTRGRRRLAADEEKKKRKFILLKKMLFFSMPSLLLIILLSLQQVQLSQESQQLGSSNAIQSVLLDTTEQSALGWTKYPDGGPQTRTPGWVEESFTNFERGINWRSFVVCDVAFDSVNNWLWTPFIERGEASRLYIELKFTLRDCNLFPQNVKSCKETFALLYKEADTPISDPMQASSATPLSTANATFAQSDSFTMVDAIAADEGRFTSNEDVVINTELRSVPVTKRGVYFAFRDQGACLSLIAIRVYHLKCPQLVTNFARFNATPTGRDLSSLVAVEGACVPNSLQMEQPRMFCAADGSWNAVSGGQCKCLAGYEPAANHTKCQACPPGKFKPQLGDLACQSCPEHSSSAHAASSECKCQESFYRAQKDSRMEPCTQPPSSPTNLTAVYLDSSTLVLQWQPPRYTGGRDDLIYKLVCDQCENTSQLLFSPQFVANFSETRCVVTNLLPGTTYRFLLYAMNGVSQLAVSVAPQFSEITVQSPKAQPQTATNTLSAQGGFQLTPIYNLRALPGARGSDMVIAWEAQPLQPAEGLPASALVDASGQQLDQQLPALYEIRYQPRFSSGHEDTPIRHSPYPPSFIANEPSLVSSGIAAATVGPQSVTTTNRAVIISTLSPRTEYAFQIRAKWAHANQWTDFSEPIYMATSSQPAAGNSQQPSEFSYESSLPLDARLSPFLHHNQNVASGYNTPSSGSSTPGGWLSSFGFLLLVALVALILGSISLMHYRKNNCMQSLGTGFGTLSGSTYGGVYGPGAGSGLMGGVIGPLGFGSPLGMHPHAHHQATLSAGSAGGLITGSNGTSRSSSGAGNVVQNFIAATLGHIGGGNSNHHHHHQNSHQKAHIENQTFGEGKLFAGSNQHAQLMRNHYHQTLGATHSMLPGQGQFQQQQQSTAHLIGQCNNNNNNQTVDSFKYRALTQQRTQGAPLFQQQDPQLHIYDDLEATCSPMQQLNSKEIEPQRVRLDSLISRAEFGDLCHAFLTNPNDSKEKSVSVRLLRPQAAEKAKVEFLLEAALMSNFDHSNVLRLEAFVSSSEPPMLVAEWTQHGPLDVYLREKKGSIGQFELISMLRGIADGMQYLAKLNFVHKDLAARNILVNGEGVCKIANLANSGSSDWNQITNSAPNSPTNQGPTLSCQQQQVDSTASSTNSSNQTLSSSGACSSSLNQLRPFVEQLLIQRLSLEQQQQQQSSIGPNNNNLSLAASNTKLPIRWTALEAIAFRRFTSASDVWSFGVVCWEVMSEGERPYLSWSNQYVIKALEAGYRLEQPNNCPDQLYRLMLDCWLKDRAARPSFSQIVRALDRLLSPYDHPFGQQQQLHQTGNVPQCANQNNSTQLAQTRLNLEPAYYETYNLINGQLLMNPELEQRQNVVSSQLPLNGMESSADEWLCAINMSRYKENFQRNQINSLQQVARLGQADLALLGVQNGQHLKRMLNAIATLRNTSSIGTPGKGYLV